MKQARARQSIPISVTGEFYERISSAVERRNEACQGSADPNWSIQRWIREACQEKIVRDTDPDS